MGGVMETAVTLLETIITSDLNKHCISLGLKYH